MPENDENDGHDDLSQLQRWHEKPTRAALTTRKHKAIKPTTCRRNLPSVLIYNIDLKEEEERSTRHLKSSLLDTFLNSYLISQKPKNISH